jgi:hypothetical protein
MNLARPRHTRCRRLRNVDIRQTFSIEPIGSADWLRNLTRYHQNTGIHIPTNLNKQ